MKRTIALFLTLATTLALMLTACGGVPLADYDLVLDERDELQTRVDTLEGELLAQDEALAETAALLEAANDALAESEKKQLAAETAMEAQQTKIEDLTDQLAAAKTQLAAQAQAQAPAAQQTAAPPASQITQPTAPPPAETVTAAPAAEPTGTMVWIPKTGSKYHSNASCSNMKNPSNVTLENAIAWGYGKCSKCW